jgi:sugar phosphate isomerase/epimerase
MKTNFIQIRGINMAKALLVFSLLFVCSSSIAQSDLKIHRKGSAAVKISLNAFSFTKPLLDKVRGRGEGMSLFEMMDWSAQHGFDGVDLTGYFFPGYPNVPSDEFINEVKRYAFKLGLDITGTGIRNNFADPDPAKRAADVKHVKEWIDVAVKLGAPVIRVFAGPIPEGYENRRDEIEK